MDRRKKDAENLRREAEQTGINTERRARMLEGFRLREGEVEIFVARLAELDDVVGQVLLENEQKWRLRHENGTGQR